MISVKAIMIFSPSTQWHQWWKCSKHRFRWQWLDLKDFSLHKCLIWLSYITSCHITTMTVSSLVYAITNRNEVIQHIPVLCLLESQCPLLFCFVLFSLPSMYLRMSSSVLSRHQTHISASITLKFDTQTHSHNRKVFACFLTHAPFPNSHIYT